MSRSMVVIEVLSGAINYADRIACDENDPLNILLAEEDEAGDQIAHEYPSQGQVIEFYVLTHTGR
jgi:hypothetical protein